MSTREASIHVELIASRSVLAGGAGGGGAGPESAARAAYAEPEVGQVNAGGQAARFVERGDRLWYVDGVATKVRGAAPLR